ncbi:phospholipid/cholesterol/gamma-HCH transport system substrate-binding protein [Actinocorallia herbida]|uniref:Phospholipid/cholesterol/gamma-HCH transport system substrate-binding protein n=1 Tax=Actinocorallia herbida TaxID=58109 RepID=A0A3N1CXC5_9ACTN|nr:MCE family protein [Actinocorallia herbida]ROO85950.1 phospholipid/cholesterol/gamma-HCH transport system substrate-binding protein [Actinocorallia herbida]
MKRAPTAVLVLVTMSAAVSGCSLQTLGAPKGDLTLYAVFDDVQNLVPGHGVQMYDVRVGSVTAVALQGYRSKVTLSLVDGTRIPVGTAATIAKTSLLGENYVKLTPPEGAVPRTAQPLASGAELAQTSVEPDLERVTARVGPVLAALGGESLEDIVGGLATGLDGSGPRLQKIIREASAVSESYADAGEDLRDLVDGLNRLGSALSGSAPELAKLPDDVVELTGRVQKDRKQLKQTLTDLTSLAETANKVIREEHGARLHTLLKRLDRVLRAVLRGKEDLKTVTRDLLEKLMKAPRVTHEGQALAYAYLAGFLPTGKAPERDFAAQLKRLLGPK